MTSSTQVHSIDASSLVWLRGLLTIAWADGQYSSEEQAVINQLIQDELQPMDCCPISKIEPEQLAAVLEQETKTTENFLRTAVMVALADGIYSTAEDKLLREFCLAIGQKPKILDTLRDHTQKSQQQSGASLDMLHSVREWLDQTEINNPYIARLICRMIPAQCPFERDVVLFGRKVVHIPPMCQLNPLYEQLVGLRFQALSYLADECNEDVSRYTSQS
jgi:tellurite resistance protein